MPKTLDSNLSPYLLGAGIGLVNCFAALTAKRMLGVTTPFESAAAAAGRATIPDVLHTNEYLKERDELPKLDWEAMVVLGIFVGSRWSSRRSEKQAADAADPWTQRFGADPAKRSIAAVLGGAAMMYGARMAKGCTSGHGITGASQLAASSWLFLPVMFLSGIATARALFGKRARS
jgi:uncharacterized protein